MSRSLSGSKFAASRKFISGEIGEAGGYLAFDLPDFGDFFPSALKFQSARAALRHVIESLKQKHVLLPVFICDSVIKAIQDAGAEITFYRLDESLFPVDLINAESSILLLYVNYFGLCSANVVRLLRERAPETVLIDNSQALFAAASDAVATIYSPRKFLPLPDGGLLIAPYLNMHEPEREDFGSIDRVRHLIIRSAYGAGAGYPDFIAAEQSLESTDSLAMSRLTRRLLRSFDLQRVKDRRRENFRTLSAILDPVNGNLWQLDPDAVPLCYPLVLPGSDVQRLKEGLISRNVFAPTYWRETRSRAVPGSVEMRLANETLYLPVDQRIDSRQASAIGNLVLELMEASYD